MDCCDEWEGDGGGVALRRAQARRTEAETRTRWKMEGDFGDLGSGSGLDSSSQRVWMSLKDEQEKFSGGGFDVVRTLLGDLNHGAHMREIEREERGRES